jgi:tetratricopeptide (TPR) repeat protein
MAAAAASPRDPEAAPWARTRLAWLELQAGRLDRAGAASRLALEARPSYGPALVVLGRIALAERRPADAVDLLARAAASQPLPETEWLLADALRAAGRSAEAGARDADLARSGRLCDPRTVALFLATRGASPADAVGLAMSELARRADVHTADAVAWALASAGRIAEARPYMAQAIAHARLFLHAGIIDLAAGDRASGRRWLARARQLDAMLLPSERGWLADAEARARRLVRPA